MRAGSEALLAGAGMLTLYVPADSAALGRRRRDRGRARRRRRRARVPLTLIRTGSRGMFWLEPLVELRADHGRDGFSPVTAADADGLIAAILAGADHPLALGPVRDIPARAAGAADLRPGGRDRPARPRRFPGACRPDRAAQGFGDGPSAICAGSPPRACAGAAAGFPAGIKWQTVLDQPAGQKYVACNADEGDSGTFADRMLMEGDRCWSSRR